MTLDSLLTMITDRRAEFAALRDLPREVMQAFREAGVYRAATPKMFGGDALRPREYLRMVERIAEVDGSAGWMAGVEVAKIYLTALPLEIQAKLYSAGPDVVFAGALFPVQPAERVPEGFRVTGQWRYASGCTHADVLAVGIDPGDGGRSRLAVLPTADAEIVENWDVIGMEGTASHDLRVNGVVVPAEWTFERGGSSNVDEPLFRYPAVPYAAQALAAVNLGIARAALDHVIHVGAGRGGLTGAAGLAERPYARIAVGRAEASLRSARAYFYEITEEVYESVLSGTPTPAQRSAIRLAATHAAAVGFEVVRIAYSLADITAISAGHPLQRCLRDASVVPHHALLTEGVYDGAGAVLMGATPFPGYV